jgi:hypothetical protein
VHTEAAPEDVEVRAVEDEDARLLGHAPSLPSACRPPGTGRMGP